MPKQEAAINAIDKTLKIQKETVTLTQRISEHVKEIWLLQYDLEKRNEKTSKEVASHPCFRAAYDFLIMRQGIDGVAQRKHRLLEATTGRISKSLTKQIQRKQV